MKKFYVKAEVGVAPALIAISKCLNEGHVGSTDWPGPLWLTCDDEEESAVRELITEAGLTITREAG